MTDFERRVTEALESGAEDSPDATGLAAAARTRARRRGRARTVGVVAAVVVAVAATPVAFSLGDGDGSTAPGVVDTPSSTPTSATAEPGWRTESFRDLEAQVPSSWRYGNLSTWCLDGRSEPGRPVVERPGGAVPAIGCGQPAEGYGVQFFSTALFDPVGGDLTDPWRYGWEPGQVRLYPRDSWLAIACATCDYAVRVVAPDEETARAVIESVRTVDGADGTGCAVRRGGDAPPVGTGTVAVCRYDADGWLQQAELLTGDDAAAATGAVEAAPADLARGPGPCDRPAEPFGEVLLREPGRDVSVVFESSCVHDNGVRFDGEGHELTRDVLYWAISPGWSGGTYGDVPLPDRLRGQE